MATLPTWPEIADEATKSLNQARGGLSAARDWLNSGWEDGHGPANGQARSEAVALVAQAKVAVDRAKKALAESAGQ